MQGRSSLWLAGSLFFMLLIGAGCRTRVHKSGAISSDMLGSEALMGMGMAGNASMGEEGTKVAETGNVEQTTNATDRLIMYDATLRVVVPHVDKALNAIRTMAANLGGYMQSLSDNDIILRIPSPRLNEAIGQVEQMGEIVSRQITGADVTEEMLDLDIRLKNTQEMHDRLVKLLDRAVKVQEMLAIEKELQRVTEALELVKGRIKYLSHAVSYSTLTVQVNSPVPQKELNDVIPFAWVRNLASDILLSPNANYPADQRFHQWLKMDLPPDFVKLSETKGSTRVLSGNGVMLLIRREINFKNGTLEFWAPIIRRCLVAEKSLALTNNEEVTLDSGAHGLKFTGTKTLGRKTYQYTLWIVASEDYVYSFECWGVADEIEKIQSQLDKTARSMKIRP